MLTAKRLEYLTDLLPENVSWGDPLNAVMLDQILAAHSAGAQEPVAEIVRWLDFTNKPRFDIKVIDKTLEHGAKLYSQPMPQTDAARDVLAERHRQVTAEGWTPAHDDEHTGCSLAVAAACYALFAAADNSDSADAWIQEWRKTARCLWPYDKEWQKATTPRRDLVKAGALILAEIERLDRRASIECGEREGKVQHGTEKATADAEMKVAKLNALPDAARDAKDAKRYRLLRERYFTRADNPNTSAYHCVGIFTSWLPAATIDRDGLDAALDAKIERLDRAKGE